jgi:hypothetical protein
MTKTRKFIEAKMFTEIENRKNMEVNYLNEYPIKNSQLADYYTLVGFINGLSWVLDADLGSVGLQEYSSEIKIKDVLANIVPHIASHDSGCTCHACITNDVLQDFINKQRDEDAIKQTGGEDNGN